MTGLSQLKRTATRFLKCAFTCLCLSLFLFRLNVYSSFPGFARTFLLLAGIAGLLTGFRLRPPADNAVLRQLVLGVRRFYERTRPETAYLHLDKNVYTTGETIWLRAYVADAARHQLDTLSKVLHVELLSDRQQVVGRRQLELTGGLVWAT